MRGLVPSSSSRGHAESRQFGRRHGGSGSALLRRAPLPLFVVALMLAAFAGGLYVARHKVFPHALLSDAYNTFVASVEVNLLPPLPIWRDWEFVDVPPHQAASRRFEFIANDHLTDPILVPGEQGRFREYCPDHVGCLAVEYAGRGEVRQVWPYRPGELKKLMEKEESAMDFPYERALGFSFLDHTKVLGVSSYANGDLLVVFRFRHSHPYGGRVGAYRPGRQAGVVPSGLQPPSPTPDRWRSRPGSRPSAQRARGYRACTGTGRPPNQDVMSAMASRSPERNRPCREAAERDLRVRCRTPVPLCPAFAPCGPL